LTINRSIENISLMLAKISGVVTVQVHEPHKECSMHH